jgi:hypothetical protein
LGSTDNDEDTDKGGRNGTDAGVELRMGVFWDAETDPDLGIKTLATGIPVSSTGMMSTGAGNERGTTGACKGDKSTDTGKDTDTEPPDIKPILLSPPFWMLLTWQS